LRKNKRKKGAKTFRENGYGHNYDNLKNKDLMMEHNNNVKKIMNRISMNSELLKDLYEKKDLPLVEKYAHEIKELSSFISATSHKKCSIQSRACCQKRKHRCSC
jgi:hypothetical protein